MTQRHLRERLQRCQQSASAAFALEAFLERLLAAANLAEYPIHEAAELLTHVEHIRTLLTRGCAAPVLAAVAPGIRRAVMDNQPTTADGAIRRSHDPPEVMEKSSLAATSPTSMPPSVPNITRLSAAALG